MYLNIKVVLIVKVSGKWSNLKDEKKIDKLWMKEQVFKDKVTALGAVKIENVWSYHYKNVDNQGNVIVICITRPETARLRA
jgi:hypothetical protein